MSKAAVERLKKEHKRLQKDPLPHIEACPDEVDILQWHYVITPPNDSLYANGVYHGKIIFPKEYPYKPPQILMLTPNGRFKTNTRLCLSMSDFHPDTWNPLWNVGTILQGVLSFMLESTATYGSMESTDEAKRTFAAGSLAYNIKDTKFCELFPHYKVKYFQSLKQSNTSTSSSTTATPIANNTTTQNTPSKSDTNAVDTRPLLPNEQTNNNNNNTAQQRPAAQQPVQRPLTHRLLVMSVIGTLVFAFMYFILT